MRTSLVGAADRNLPSNAGGTGSIPGLRIFHIPEAARPMGQPGPCATITEAHALEARKPQQLSLRVASTESTYPRAYQPQYWACVLQLPKPSHLKPMLHNRGGHCNEKPTHRNRKAPFAPTRESLYTATNTQHSQKTDLGLWTELQNDYQKTSNKVWKKCRNYTAFFSVSPSLIHIYLM